MEELLRVEHLRKIFTAADRNDFLAVDDVTFSIGQGEKVALMGSLSFHTLRRIVWNIRECFYF